MPSVLFQ